MLLHVIHLNISFIPLYLSRTGACGAPTKKPVFNSWAYLSLQDVHAPNPLPPPSNTPLFSQSATSITLTNILANDSNTTWSIHPLYLMDISSIVDKTNLPIDYTTPASSNTAYVNKTFHQVKQVYDHKKPLHHLILLIFLIVTCLCPTLFLPTNPSIRSHFVTTDIKDNVKTHYFYKQQ